MAYFPRGFHAFRLLFFLLLAAPAFGQLPSAQCDSASRALAACPFLTYAANYRLWHHGRRADVFVLGSGAGGHTPENETGDAFLPAPRTKHQGFHWRRALMESFAFLAIEQAYVVHDDFRWVTSENGVPFNHYWRDYKQSLSTWIHSGWDDGDPVLYSYVGHPIQGAFTGYIQIQNDPQGEKLEFANSKAYWWSRTKALLWNTAYSTQWNIGPLSELTVEKYGARVRSPWNRDGTWPCTRRPCFTGVGQVDLVITPTAGFAWILTEDFLDRNIARRLEGGTRNRFVVDFVRCALNPIRGGANILHGKAPWYRASRDARQVYFAHLSEKQSRSPSDSSEGENH